MGKVTLIGAGPGAADLLTVRGARILGEAQVVVHDALISEEIFAYCPNALRISVGKRCGKQSTAQLFINRQLVALAGKYERVVRLKGGDPMLFGRADEEMQALEAAGIEYDVVPGITTALAAAAAIRKPLTKRGVARSVAFATQAKGREGVASDEADHTVRADSVVYYMGRDQATAIARQLLEAGRPADTPAWVVESVSTPMQRARAFTLGGMARGDAAAWVRPDHPCLLMIGKAFAMRANEQPGRDGNAGDGLLPADVEVLKVAS